MGLGQGQAAPTTWFLGQAKSVGVVGVPMSAHAKPIVAGEGIGISINENAGGENIALTGSIGFIAVSSTQMVFDIDLANASSHGARMVSIGFDIAVVDSLTGTNTSGGLDVWKVELDPKWPMNGIRVNLCIWVAGSVPILRSWNT
ncbi:MAG: hypothetical protein JJT88_12255 [Gammaproteobacteria bacterium]|nr:hypothetical protein [Gammaproteobacteria bacterium]